MEVKVDANQLPNCHYLMQNKCWKSLVFGDHVSYQPRVELSTAQCAAMSSL